jgi:uncharacterized damage-inducible protein DinB
MRNAVRTCSALAASIVIASSTASAQSRTADIKAEVLKDWTDLKETLVKIANEMPEDKYSFKPTPPQQTYGERVLHVATVNATFLRLLGGKAAPPAINAKATAKTEIVKAMADSFDYGTALINEQTSETIRQTVQAKFLGESSRSRLVYFLIGHTWDIYGQLAVYLRLNGGVPPASQRP